jgi:energy-coupling factor transporter transmembrane protein EcfT
MANVTKLLLLFAYSITVFFAAGIWLLPYLAVNVILMAVTKITPLAALRYISGALPFILFAAVINLILGSVMDSVWLSLRLFLVCNVTQCFRKSVSIGALGEALETLASPLRVFKVNSRDVGLVVCIAIAFIPVLRRDFGQIRMALRAKGMKVNFRNFKYLVLPFFTGLFKRTSEIADALNSKGYQ